MTFCRILNISLINVVLLEHFHLHNWSGKRIAEVLRKEINLNDDIFIPLQAEITFCDSLFLLLIAVLGAISTF
jgi:hypothetical protein